MPWFHYKAVGSDGQLLQGDIQGHSQESVVAQLQELGQTPIQVEERRPGRRLSWLGRNAIQADVTRFTRDLSGILKAGVPLEEALEMLADFADTPRSALMIERLLDDVRSGSTLADAMAAQGNVFNRFYINMVKAAEAGGALETVLSRLGDYLAQYEETKRNIKTALIYPGILLAVTLLSLILLVVFVIPTFSTLFEEMGQQLPLPTRVVMLVGESLLNYWWLLAAVMVIIAVFARRLLANPKFRVRWDRWVLRMPVFGNLVIKIETSIFARALYTLLDSGVPLLTALSIVKGTMTNHVIVETVDSLASSVQEGRGLAGPLMISNRFPRLAAYLVKVGEETGRLEPMLFQLAEIYDGEVRVALQRMLALLEPLLIVGLGLIIGGVIMSIFIGILSVNELAF